MEYFDVAVEILNTPAPLAFILCRFALKVLPLLSDRVANRAAKVEKAKSKRRK